MDPATEPDVPKEHQQPNRPESETTSETTCTPFVAVPEPFGAIAEEDARNRNEKNEAAACTSGVTPSLF